jgi:hypothetical protein
MRAHRVRLVRAWSDKRFEKAVASMEPEPGTIYTKTYRDKRTVLRRVKVIDGARGMNVDKGSIMLSRLHCILKILDILS